MFETYQKYPKIMRFFHHLSAVLIITLLVVGIYMSDLPRDNPNKMTLYTIHKTVGWLTLFLIIARIISKVLYQPLLKKLPSLWQIGASLGHFSLYVLMLVMPISGWLMSSAAGYPVVLFGIESLTIPNLIDKDSVLKDLFKEIHEISGWLIIALIVVHAVAAIYHKIKRDDVWSRMWH
jgi:cytochrome b561